MSGHSARTASSALSTGSTSSNPDSSTASGRSIKRDQCETSGCAPPKRASVMSNQDAPDMSSRTSIRRVASSVSPSELMRRPGSNQNTSAANTPTPSAHQASSAPRLKRAGAKPSARRHRSALVRRDRHRCFLRCVTTKLTGRNCTRVNTSNPRCLRGPLGNCRKGFFSVRPLACPTARTRAPDAKEAPDRPRGSDRQAAGGSTWSIRTSLLSARGRRV